MLDSCENSATEFTEYDWKIDEPIIEIYTSGTSGKRKLIEKSIKNYFGGKGFRPEWRFLIRILKARMYNCSPWYHNTGIYMLLFTVCGSEIN